MAKDSVKAAVLVTFDGIAEGRRFEAGDTAEFPRARFEKLAALGYVTDAPKPRRRKAAEDE